MAVSQGWSELVAEGFDQIGKNLQNKALLPGRL